MLTNDKFNKINSYYGQRFSEDFVFTKQVIYICDYIEIFPRIDTSSQRCIISFLNNTVDEVARDLVGIICLPCKEIVKTALERIYASIEIIEKDGLNEEQSNEFSEISRRIAPINKVLRDTFKNELLVLSRLNQIENAGADEKDLMK
jgi:hypothetical protein